ncbi:hypothetical protein Cgig2_003245 [Carnegiea gigantea]|uniref:Uncharacterized protein n=1 Tax=Carnegiea gigantea TaxID=171969 RepID=A0A9Q1JHA3_9CARY|nr:hypothetical protein Cgig2_003245 [Carnegiea gigantea]
MAKGNCTETFMSAFLSNWLYTFILLVKNIGYIHPRIVNIALFIASGSLYPQPTVHSSDSKRKCSDLSNRNIPKYEGIHGSRPKLNIVRSGMPLDPFVPPTNGDSSYIKIPRIHVAMLATPIPTILIQSITPSPQVTNEIKEHFKSSPTEICRQKLNSMINRTIDRQDKLLIKIYEPSTKKVDNNVARAFDQAKTNKMSHTPFDGLPSFKGDIDNLYAIILQRGDITPL